MSCCPEFTTWNGNYKYTNAVSSASEGVAKSMMIPEIHYNADDCPLGQPKESKLVVRGD